MVLRTVNVAAPNRRQKATEKDSLLITLSCEYPSNLGTTDHLISMCNAVGSGAQRYESGSLQQMIVSNNKGEFADCAVL